MPGTGVQGGSSSQAALGNFLVDLTFPSLPVPGLLKEKGFLEQQLFYGEVSEWKTTYMSAAVQSHSDLSSDPCSVLLDV